MEKKVLDIIRSEYEKEIIKIEKYNALKQRKTELEQNSKVQEYLEILQELDKYEKKTIGSDILYNIYTNKMHMIKETSEIYVYMGTYCSSEKFNIRGNVDQCVSKDDPNADYNIYIDIEKGLKSIRIPMSQCDMFEQNHIIVEAGNFYEYKKLQKIFIEELVINGEESAIQKIKKKTDKN